MILSVDRVRKLEPVRDLACKEHEIIANCFCRSGSCIGLVVRDDFNRCSSSRPERLFFVEKTWSNSRSIPVKVAAGKAAKPEKRAGVGMHGKGAPAPCNGAATKLQMRIRNPRLSIRAAVGQRRSRFEEKRSRGLWAWGNEKQKKYGKAKRRSNAARTRRCLSQGCECAHGIQARSRV